MRVNSSVLFIIYVFVYFTCACTSVCEPWVSKLWQS